MHRSYLTSVNPSSREPTTCSGSTAIQKQNKGGSRLGCQARRSQSLHLVILTRFRLIIHGAEVCLAELRRRDDFPSVPGEREGLHSRCARVDADDTLRFCLGRTQH